MPGVAKSCIARRNEFDLMLMNECSGCAAVRAHLAGKGLREDACLMSHCRRDAKPRDKLTARNQSPQSTASVHSKPRNP
jgi:hypothetical protein